MDPIKDKKALNYPMIANKKIKAKKEQPNRPQENPKKIKETQEPPKKRQCHQNNQQIGYLEATEFMIQRIQTYTATQ